jgi:hypothetical protein
MVSAWVLCVAVVGALIAIGLAVWAVRRWFRKTTTVTPVRPKRGLSRARRSVAWDDDLHVMPDSPTRARRDAMDMDNDPKAMAQMILGSTDVNDQLHWCRKLFEEGGWEGEFSSTSESVGRKATLEMCRDVAEMTLGQGH